MQTYSHCMTLGLCCFHQQVDICQSTMVELFLQILVFLLGSYSHWGLSLWRISSSCEAQGEVNIPRAAPEGVNIFTNGILPALGLWFAVGCPTPVLNKSSSKFSLEIYHFPHKCVIAAWDYICYYGMAPKDQYFSKYERHMHIKECRV